MIDKVYKCPYLIFKKYFPNGTKEEFDKSFVTFDVSKEEFEYLKEDISHNHKLVCLETAVFDLYYIFSEYNLDNIIDTFRE